MPTYNIRFWQGSQDAEWLIVDFTNKNSLSSESDPWLRNTIQCKLTTSRISPGEMVGVVSAQSLGQPIMQMTLNTFHSAGISAKMLGV